MLKGTGGFVELLKFTQAKWEEVGVDDPPVGYYYFFLKWFLGFGFWYFFGGFGFPCCFVFLFGAFIGFAAGFLLGFMVLLNVKASNTWCKIAETRCRPPLLRSEKELQT